jgi:PAS domain S-box-containing protein
METESAKRGGIGEHDPHEGEARPGWDPVCTSRETPTACCIILDSITDGVFAVDRQRRITSFFNRAAERITGFSQEEAVGTHCFDILRSSLCQTECLLERTLTTGAPVYNCPCAIINKEGKEVPLTISTALIRDASGEVVAMVEVLRDLTLVESLRKSLTAKYRLGDMISKSSRMQELFEILPDVAESNSTVLIQGPSGSGKEVLASAIHEMSPRKGKPFVKVNCAAIPDTLLESELFGYVKGAFTDARRDKPGRFALAHRGTLLLDEVGDMSPALQVKLLRVLEDHQYFPLGAITPVTADVRIIAASNKDLAQLVNGGAFREDLYYRLDIIKIQLPTLSERREDIPLLVDHFLTKLNTLKGKNLSGVTHEVLGLLMNYRFPGNVRELENILEHACVVCRGSMIEVRHLPLEFVDKARHGSPEGQRPPSPLEGSEARTIQTILKKHEGNRALAARELGVSRSTLWRKIKRFHLE